MHGLSSSWLEQFPSVQQGVNSPEEDMYGSQSLSALPPPSSWQNGPPRLGEEYRDHMTLPQALGQLLGCQRKPRPSKALHLSPAQGWPATAACIQLRLWVCLARAHFCLMGIDKNLLQTSTVLGSPD